LKDLDGQVRVELKWLEDNLPALAVG